MNAATARLLDVPLDQVRPHPDNPRRNLGDLADLAASIRAQGILEPLLVEPHADDPDTYQLIAGHRRLAAAARAGLDTVPVVVRATSSLGPQILAMLTENGQRSDLTEVEEGDAYQLLLDLPEDALTVADIAASTGRSKKAVQDRLKITKLPESAHQRILHGQLDLDHAARMAGFANDKAALERLDRAAAAGPIALERTLEEEKNRRTREANQQKAERAFKKEATAAGIRWMPYSEWKSTSNDDVWTVSELPDAPDFEAEDSSDEAYDKAELALDEWHKDCPGRALTMCEPLLNSGSGYRVALCTRPELHDEDNPTAAPGEVVRLSEDDAKALAAREAEAKQRKADEAALAALRQRLEATAVARRKFLGEVVRAKETEKRAHASALARFDHRLEGSNERQAQGRRVLAQIVLPNISDTVLQSTDLPKKLRAALEKLTTAQLIVLDEMTPWLWNELALEDPTNWQWSTADSATRNWVTLLVREWGWERFPEEQALVDGHTAGKPFDQVAPAVAREFCGGDAS
ncbi:ParB/RepB/Spo0J family partition protein [Calidifontibacter indicus]|uniref:ParB/RepB/Spo0J family partition protein n=1 Tax=Calidifontibacter indicus TaxID=419650 RepID=UPI003D74AA22